MNFGAGPSASRVGAPSTNIFLDGRSSNHQNSNHRPNAPAQPNVAFYRNKYPLPHPMNMRIDVFHARMRANYPELEKQHCYIQWIFPLMEESRTVRSEHYALSDEEAALFATDPEIGRRVIKSLEVMLDFLGFEFRAGSSSSSSSSTDVIVGHAPPSSSSSSSSSKAVATNSSNGKNNRSNSSNFNFTLRPLTRNFSGRARDWISHPHNDKRITRMLKFLNIIGMGDLATAILYAFAQQIEASAAEMKRSRAGALLLNPFMDVADTFVDHWLPCCREQEAVAELLQRIKGGVMGEEVTQVEFQQQLLKADAAFAAKNADDDDDDDDNNDGEASRPAGNRNSNRNKPGEQQVEQGGSAAPRASTRAELAQAPPRPGARDSASVPFTSNPSPPERSFSVGVGGASRCRDPRCPCDADPRRIGHMSTMPLAHNGYCCDACKSGVRCISRNHSFSSPRTAAAAAAVSPPTDTASTVAKLNTAIITTTKDRQQRLDSRRHDNDDDDDDASEMQTGGGAAAAAAAVDQKRQEQPKPKPGLISAGDRDAANVDGTCVCCSERQANPGKALCTTCFVAYLRVEMMVAGPPSAKALASARHLNNSNNNDNSNDDDVDDDDEHDKAKRRTSISSLSASQPASITACNNNNKNNGNRNPFASRYSLFPPLGKCVMCATQDNILPGSSHCDNCSVATAMQLESYADGWRENSNNPLHKNGLVRFANNNGLFFELSNTFECILRDSADPTDVPGASYTNAEAMFQANKFLQTKPAVAEMIRRSTSAPEAVEIARRHLLDERSDWFSVRDRVMLEVLRRKFTQSIHCQRALLATGSSDIEMEGDFLNGNKLGKLLVIVRSEIREGGGTGAKFGEPLSARDAQLLAAGALSYASTFGSAALPAPSNTTSSMSYGRPAASGGLSAAMGKQPPGFQSRSLYGGGSGGSSRNLGGGGAGGPLQRPGSGGCLRPSSQPPSMRR